MMASAAEKRIRGKAEAALRQVWPAARIVHELVLQQGKCRVDLAAITEDRLIVVEVKSERDTLVRLREQARQANEVSDGFTAVLANRHWQNAWEGNYVSIAEASKEDEILDHLRGDVERVRSAPTNTLARLEMLWAAELKRVAGLYASRQPCIEEACKKFTESEIRKRVCAALRARPFPQGDPPILSDLFPKITKGQF